MKQHSTNYFNTFIEVAEDCSTETGLVPPKRGEKKTIANYQYDLVQSKPYQLTSDEIFFKVFAIRKDLAESEMDAERKKYFSKGQPCFRASPLTKSYGWGVHSNADGKVAIYARESAEYQRFLENEDIKKVKAMRSKRK